MNLAIRVRDVSPKCFTLTVGSRDLTEFISPAGRDGGITQSPSARSALHVGVSSESSERVAPCFPFLPPHPPCTGRGGARRGREGAGEMPMCREGTDRVSLPAGRPQEAAGCPEGHDQEQTRCRLGEGRGQRGREWRGSLSLRA